MNGLVRQTTPPKLKNDTESSAICDAVDLKRITAVSRRFRKRKIIFSIKKITFTRSQNLDLNPYSETQRKKTVCANTSVAYPAESEVKRFVNATLRETPISDIVITRKRRESSPDKL